MRIPESNPSPRRVGRAMAWGVAIGVGAVVLRELVRPREQPAHLIDWERVEEIALARCGEPKDLPADPAIDQTYQQIAAQLEPQLGEAGLSGADRRRPPPVGALQHPDLPADVRAARGAAAAYPRVADAELRPEG